MDISISEYVLKQINMGINEWLAIINSDGLSRHERLILECANDHNKITINESIQWRDCINS